jgi:hypothetical protein
MYLRRVRLKRSCNSRLDKAFLVVTCEYRYENTNSNEDKYFKNEDEDWQERKNNVNTITEHKKGANPIISKHY